MYGIASPGRYRVLSDEGRAPARNPETPSGLRARVAGDAADVRGDREEAASSSADRSGILPSDAHGSRVLHLWRALHADRGALTFLLVVVAVFFLAGCERSAPEHEAEVAVVLMAGWAVLAVALIARQARSGGAR